MSKGLRLLYYIPGSTLSEREMLYNQGMYRGEMAYGAFQMKEFGAKVVQLSPLKNWQGTISRFLYTCYLLLHAHQYDAIYSPYFSGLEYVIRLRGLRLFPKKILIWHHNPIEKECRGRFARLSQRWFYHGCDALFMFSDSLKTESLLSGLQLGNKTFVLNWGPDMSFYDKIRQPYKCSGSILMSGMDSRDFNTLLCVCKKKPNAHFIVVPPNDEIAEKFSTCKNVTVKRYPATFEGYYQLALETAKVSLVLILTKPVEGRKLPSGLTSICEAVGLGKPCVITRNPYFSKELLNAGFASFVDVGDVDTICGEICRLLADVQECEKMSGNALRYARMYDVRHMTQQMASIIENSLQ